MADLQLLVRGDKIIFREADDRNGPNCEFELADKQALRSAIQSLTTDGDEEIFPNAKMGKETDSTNNSIGWFTEEADADDFVTGKGGNSAKHSQKPSADGVDWVVTG